MTSKCCGQKAVIVAVYTERPQPPSHHHHYHHDHGRRRGYNRKAELLDYARNLRASAQHQNSHNNQLSTVNQTTAADRKPKSSSSPTCLGKWEFLIPTFGRSMTVLNTTKDKKKKKHKNSVSAATKMKAIMKSMQVRKRTSFLSKLLRKLQKHG